MKKILTILLAILLAALCAGCFGDSSDSKDGSGASFTVDQKIGDVYDTVTAAYSGSVSVEEIPAYVDELYAATDTLAADGTITYREKQNTCVYVEDRDGIGVFLAAPNDELSASGGTLEYFCYQPFHRSTIGKNLNTELVDQTESVYSALAYGDRTPTSLRDEAVTVSQAKNFTGDSVILWSGHGEYCDRHGSCLLLSYFDKTGVTDEDYRKGRVCFCKSYSDTYTVLTPEFFDDYYKSGSLDNAVIYLATCQSAYDVLSGGSYHSKTLTDTLRSKGAAAVFATSDSIYSDYDRIMAYDVLTAMAQGSSAEQSLALAKQKNGDNDCSHRSYTTKSPAAVDIYGDRSYTLHAPDTTYTNTEYGWSVTVPAAWYTYGTVIDKGDFPDADQYGSVFFYHKELYEQTGRGFVFAIIAVPVDSYRNDGRDGGTGTGDYLGTNGRYAFYWFRAVDVQADPNAADYYQREAEYNQLALMRETILATFTIL